MEETRYYLEDFFKQHFETRKLQRQIIRKSKIVLTTPKGELKFLPIELNEKDKQFIKQNEKFQELLNKMIFEACGVPKEYFNDISNLNTTSNEHKTNKR